MKQRLEQFLSAENLTKAQFADSIDMARAGISHIIAGRNNPSYEFIVNTMRKYPDLNIEWLLTGKGKMYKSNLFSETPPQNAAQLHESDFLADSLFGAPQNESPDSAADLAVAATSSITSTSTSTFTSTEPRQNVIRQASEPVKTEPATETVTRPDRKVKKILLFYSDGTYQEFC